MCLPGGLDQAVSIMEVWPLGTANSILEVHCLGGWNTRISVLTPGQTLNDSREL